MNTDGQQEHPYDPKIWALAEAIYIGGFEYAGSERIRPLIECSQWRIDWALRQAVAALKWMEGEGG